MIQLIQKVLMMICQKGLRFYNHGEGIEMLYHHVCLMMLLLLINILQVHTHMQSLDKPHYLPGIDKMRERGSAARRHLLNFCRHILKY